MTSFEGFLLFLGLVLLIFILVHIRMTERHLERLIDIVKERMADQSGFHDQRFKDSKERLESAEKYLQYRIRHLEERIDRRSAS